ncbi:MAG: DALR anticodon-binding domain-containing protein, partial [Myxococcota bacterium]
PFKRVTNLLRGAKPGDIVAAAPVEEVESRLHSAYQEVSAEVASARAEGDYRRAFAAIAQLRPTVDAFFDGVMVMTEDPEERGRRLALLAQAQAVFAPLADFTKLS